MNFCTKCGRFFGGVRGFTLAHAGDKCANKRELRKRGLHQNDLGVWVRSPGLGQTRLWDARTDELRQGRTVRGNAHAPVEAPTGQGPERAESEGTAARTAPNHEGAD